MYKIGFIFILTFYMREFFGVSFVFIFENSCGFDIKMVYFELIRIKYDSFADVSQVYPNLL